MSEETWTIVPREMLYRWERVVERLTGLTRVRTFRVSGTTSYWVSRWERDLHRGDAR